MIIGILKEQEDHRVSMVPDVAAKLIAENNEVIIESGAGKDAFFTDDDYLKIGCKVASREEVYKKAEILLSISPIGENDLMNLKKGTLYISSFRPLSDSRMLKSLEHAGLTALSLDNIPRITMAQTMDILSSMASISGYKAVIMAAGYLPRYFPMLTTAAGSIPPAKVLVLGAGVAGLQAIATAWRLGAVVEAFDTRRAAREEVESLGAKFVEVEGAKDDKSAGGYAVEQTEEYKEKQNRLIFERAAKADVIISTALLRGKHAPVLITKEMVQAMKPGSVIVDLAASAGGNCELTKPGEIINAGKITIIGIKEFSSTLPLQASQLYSKNVYNFIRVFLKEGKTTLDQNNEVIKHSAIVVDGEVKYGI